MNGRLILRRIGRTLARSLGANEDLVEAICLAHDLGHSPFGHSGEVALARLMKDHGGFDHNRQSLRIVTELEQRYPEFPGLNLSWEVREGMVKHESEYDISDARDFNPDLRGNLETQIANVADELEHIQSHTLLGERILQPFLTGEPTVLQVVRSHHERLDGRGFPDGLRGDSIPLPARIVAVADAYDAMTTNHAYRSPCSVDEALERLRAGSGNLWDGEIVEILASM